MKILVTGGTGLVGYGLQQIYNQYEYEFLFMSSKDCDLVNYEATKVLFEKHKPDYVIHLAACVGGLFKNMNQKVEMFEKNTLINCNVLKVCDELNINRVLSCLSTCIFPDKTSYPIDETMLHYGPPHCSNDAYAYSKRMLEVHSKAYQQQYGDKFICVIPTNIYGENDNYNLNDAHVIPALIHKCWLAQQQNEKFVVCGTGKPLRQFIYSRDLAILMMWTLEHYDSLDTLILSVGEKEETSIGNVAKLIAKAFCYDHMMEFDTGFSDGQYKKTANNRNLIKHYGDYIFTPIETGIEKSVKWFQENYEKCRK